MEALAKCGANVVLAAIPVKTNVSQEFDVLRLVKVAVERFGSLEILVNNAGIASLSPSVDMSLEEWKEVIDVNLTGVFLCARTTAREMIKKNYGKIVNIASKYGAVGHVFHVAPYYASKGAVINLPRALAIEWAQHKINVKAIALGFFPAKLQNKFSRTKVHSNTYSLEHLLEEQGNLQISKRYSFTCHHKLQTTLQDRPSSSTEDGLHSSVTARKEVRTAHLMSAIGSVADSAKTLHL